MSDPLTKTPFPTPFQSKTLWAAITGVSIGVIGCIAVALIVLMARILQFLQPVLVPLAVAGIIAYLLEPVIDKLISRGVPRMRALVVVFCSMVAALVIIVLLIVPVVTEQGFNYLQDRAAITEKAGDWIESNLLRIEKLVKPWLPLGVVPEETKAGHWSNYQLHISDDPGAAADEDAGNLVMLAWDGNALKNIHVIDAEGARSYRANDELVNKPAQLNELNGLLRQRFRTDTQTEAENVAPPPADEVILAKVSELLQPKPHWLKMQIRDWLLDHYPGLLARLWKFASSGLQGFLGVFGYIVGLFLVPVYLYYFLKESASIQENWSNYLPLQQSRFRDEVVATLTEINGYLISFFRGQMLVSMIDGATIGICLTLIGLPNGLLIGVFVALLGLIPYIGNLLCWIPAVLISIAHFGAVDQTTGELLHTWGWLPDGAVWPYPLIVTGIFIIVQQINGLVTTPRIVGDSVGLHPLTVIFSVFFWSLLIGGLLGALLAVPLTASLKVLFQRYVWEKGKDIWEQRQAARTVKAG